MEKDRIILFLTFIKHLTIIMPKYLGLVFFMTIIGIYGQPKDSVRMPLDIPLYLSGTFGELRSNHFHSGLDIKTNGEEGLPVYAIDDGYVYRIKINRRGYGKALYVKHPNGLISVYGHLQKFNPAIENYIKQKQYKKLSFEIEVFPYKIELPVKKGEIIAYSGNTGGSSGPHLHFEIRNYKEHPLNPMSYGFIVEDSIRPKLTALFGYTLDSLSHINQTQGRIPLFFHKENDSTYTTDPIIAYGKIGFGVVAYDRQNKTFNRNGLYKVQVFNNATLVYEHILEELSFFWSHYVNMFMDYPYYRQKRKKIQKLFVEPANRLEIYTQLVNDGMLNIQNKKTYYIKIVLQDFNGNSTYIKIPVYGVKAPIVEKEKINKSPYRVKAGRKTSFDFGKVKIIFQKNSAYKDFYLHYDAFRNGFEISNDFAPIHKPMIIKYNIARVPKKYRKYLYLGRKAGKGIYYTTSKIQGDTLVAYSSRTGKYIVSMDTVPPKLFPVNFKPKQNLTDYRFLHLETFDLETGIKNYNGYIDGQWILLEYDYKKNSLIYDFSDKKLSGYKHTLEVKVTDNVGNESTFKTFFYRKEK